jgi:hypothetical protein
MKFQVRFNGADAVIRGLPADEQAALTAEFEGIRTLPGVLDANQLLPPDTATTVRVIDGRTSTAEGSAVPPDDDAQCGYYIYDTSDLDSAIAFASRIPDVRVGGTIEVRALRES